MSNHKLIGFIVIGLGTLVLLNALFRLFSFDLVQIIWPVALILGGLVAATRSAMTGMIICLVGVLALISRFHFAQTGFGQGTIAVVLVMIGLVVLVGIADKANGKDAE